MPKNADNLDERDLAKCLALLRSIAENPEQSPLNGNAEELIARIYKANRKRRRKQREKEARTRDRVLSESTAMCGKEPAAALPATMTDLGDRRLRKPRHCYVCKAKFQKLHSFYHLLCPACAEFNMERRSQRADLCGRRALLTGGRIKIGFETALKLLRDGAEVHMTTRFPKDAARRYASEPDFSQWSDRLKIYALDLRHVPSVLSFTQFISTQLKSIDILINNAAQTVRRPNSYYEHLKAIETGPAAAPALLSQWNSPLIEPNSTAQSMPVAAALDRNGELIDLSAQNSWVLKASEVEDVEVLETFLINSISPYMLTAHLRSVLARSRFKDRYVVNVSAMEGQFRRANKTPFHPHTNMAKAALNMLTRTSATEFAEDRIYMNSVDTGWITEENPHAKKTRLREKGFVPPLDEVDGASRIYDPVARGVNGSPVWGQFLKDYAPVAW